MNIKSMDEVVAYVTKNGFGLEENTFPGLYISQGIKYVLENDREIWDEYIGRALKQADKKDYGGFMKWESLQSREESIFYVKVLLGKTSIME